jgi:hypothetical protein
VALTLIAFLACIPLNGRAPVVVGQDPDTDDDIFGAPADFIAAVHLRRVEPEPERDVE